MYASTFIAAALASTAVANPIRRQIPSNVTMSGIPANIDYACEPSGYTYNASEVQAAGDRAASLTAAGRTVTALDDRLNKTTFPKAWSNALDIALADACEHQSLLVFPAIDYTLHPVPGGKIEVFGDDKSNDAAYDRIVYTPAGHFCALITSKAGLNGQQLCGRSDQPSASDPLAVSSTTASTSLVDITKNNGGDSSVDPVPGED